MDVQSSTPSQPWEPGISSRANEIELGALRTPAHRPQDLQETDSLLEHRDQPRHFPGYRTHPSWDLTGPLPRGDLLNVLQNYLSEGMINTDNESGAFKTGHFWVKKTPHQPLSSCPETSPHPTRGSHAGLLSLPVQSVPIIKMA